LQSSRRPSYHQPAIENITKEEPKTQYDLPALTYPVKIEKRVYDKEDDGDGKRILVMRFWPRGVRKTAIDLWMKEVGTGPELIKDWKAGKITWARFTALYKKQMQGDKEKKLIAELRGYANEGPITLLCTDKDPDRCHRSILKELIERRQ
jgi:uncharacterized protein YeaO (DUF488 family)